jgi:hypothetical protein
LEIRLWQRVSLALRKTLNTHNICKKFEAIGIWPLNLNIMINKIQPNETFMETNFTNVKAHDPKFHAKIQANELFTNDCLLKCLVVELHLEFAIST